MDVPPRYDRLNVPDERRDAGTIAAGMVSRKPENAPGNCGRWKLPPLEAAAAQC
jgi:hypothetical protein